MLEITRFAGRQASRNRRDGG